MIPPGMLRPRLPAAGWEGWFWILIPRRSAHVRWCKVHLFRRRAGSGHALAAVEGLDEHDELVSWIGATDGVEQLCSPLTTAAVAVDANSEVELRAGPSLRLRNEPPTLALERSDEAHQLVARFEPQQIIEWIRVRRLVTYLGAHCRTQATLRWRDQTHALDGLGVFEHAWGALLPLDPLRLVGGRWQWDVLGFDADEPRDALAALSLPLPLPLPLPWLGRSGWRVRGRIDGQPLSGRSSFALRVLEGEQVPRRWLGRVRTAGGELQYEAQASTPTATAVPGGGFVGFDFAGTWHRRGAAPRPVRGRGFSESGGPAGASFGRGSVLRP